MMKYYRAGETTLFEQALTRKSIKYPELIRLLVCNQQQIKIDDNSNFQYLNKISEIHISDNPSLINQETEEDEEKSGFQIPAKSYSDRQLLLARCYFDEFHQSQEPV